MRLTIGLGGTPARCHRGRKCIRRCEKDGKPDSGHRTGSPIGSCHEGPCWPTEVKAVEAKKR